MAGKTGCLNTPLGLLSDGGGGRVVEDAGGGGVDAGAVVCGKFCPDGVDVDKLGAFDIDTIVSLSCMK